MAPVSLQFEVRSRAVLLFLLLLQNVSHGQSSLIGVTNAKRATQPKTEDSSGIIYFSYDNGNSWKNVSDGLPQQVQIGLGGISSSGNTLGLATKEDGVYIFDVKKGRWIKTTTPSGIVKANIGGLCFYRNMMLLGTQQNGVFCSVNNGRTWIPLNNGLKDLTVRRFIILNEKLFVGTNSGFYALDERSQSWKAELEEHLLQVNGATLFQNQIYLATSKGVFTKAAGKTWKNVLPNNSVHNISTGKTQLFAMTYTNLLLASSDGTNWKSAQNGLPPTLYTFNVLAQNGLLFAGQWDGIYRKQHTDPRWTRASTGLPSQFAATNLISYQGILVISTSERKLKPGVADHR